MKYNQELLLTPVTKAHGLLRDIKGECEIKANLYSKKQIENMLNAAKAYIDEAEQILRKRKFNSEPKPLLNKANVSGSCEDMCPKCGAEYDDILGIGSCGKCFYGHDR